MNRVVNRATILTTGNAKKARLTGRAGAKKSTLTTYDGYLRKHTDHPLRFISCFSFYRIYEPSAS